VTPQARVVHTRVDVDAAFVRLGREIEEAFPAGALLVAVQRGSIFVLADLVRRIGVGCEVDFLSVSDYEGGSGRARIVQDLATDVHGRDVVLVEDIVDTGLTCEYVLQTLRGRGPASLAVLALLDRRARRIVPVPVQFVGFEVTDELLIGRGLGVAGRYRNLEVIAAADASVLESDRDAYVTQFYGDRVEQPATR
jgi:hypoxanthine phosphoribosyltransferase